MSDTLRVMLDAMAVEFVNYVNATSPDRATTDRVCDYIDACKVQDLRQERVRALAP